MALTRDVYGYHQDPSLENCKFTLHNKDLWTKFHNLETEMIITKSGRRMFPAIRVQVENLDPRAHYCVFIEMTLASKCRYKYSASSGWAPAGTEEAQSPQRLYVHPDSPATGEQWMTQPISFGRLKLTNTLNPQAGQVVLSSMHKYQPRIVIMKSVDPQAYSWAPSTSVAFPETQFIAVTAYQNDRITKLKIDNNPFAKGFRENGQAKCKRKRNQDESLKDEEEIDVITTKHCPSPRVESDQESEASSSPAVVQTGSLSPNTSYFPQGITPTCYPRNLTHPSFISPIYPGHYDPYYPRYHPSMYQFGRYFNYGQVFPEPLLSKPIYFRPLESKPTKITDFSIKAITGMS